MSSDEPVCAGREIINKILRLTTVRQNIGMDLSSCTCKVRKEGVAVPMLIFPKGVADKIEKINGYRIRCKSFFHATVYIKQCRILFGKFVLTYIRP